jgi:hypothetical protein
MRQNDYRVLLVCMGNICRSTAEGVLRCFIKTITWAIKLKWILRERMAITSVRP